MKEWENPEVKELGVESTEHGDKITNHVDDVYTNGKYNFWSFS